MNKPDVHKQIVTQDGDRYWNVTHIAGFSLEEISGGFIGIKAHSGVNSNAFNGGGIYIYTSSDAVKTKKSFHGLLSFLGNDQTRAVITYPHPLDRN